MGTQEFDAALDQGLAMMSSGATIDDCVARYPEYASELRAQLVTARTLLQARPSVEPQSAARAQGRTRLLAAVGARRETAAANRGLGLPAPVQAFFSGKSLSRPALVARAAPAAIALLLLGGAAWGVSAAVGNPNPGDWFVGESSSAQRVELRGVIVAMDTDSLTIDTASGTKVVGLTGQTEFEDASGSATTIAVLALGDLIKVSAFLDENGALVAHEVELQDAGEDEAQGDDDAEGDDNSGPGNADDGDDDQEDSSGPGDADDGDDLEDSSGPGSADDDDGHEDNSDDGDDHGDNSGPGDADDGDDHEDNSGPGNDDDGHEGDDGDGHEDDDDDHDDGREDDEDESGPDGGHDDDDHGEEEPEEDD